MINSKDNIVVVGSQNANEGDRSLSRAEIKSVQLYKDGDHFEAISFFNSVGELGVSSICWEPENPLVLFYTSGTEIWSLDLKTKEQQRMEIPKLRGVHEISFIQGKLWISNTYFDEVICFDPKNKLIEKRLKLKSAGQNVREVQGVDVDLINQERENKFHCNQIFESYEGVPIALVHHVNGEQIINRVAQKLIKSQGNGGVLFLESGKTERLKLKAPHSVRKVNEAYWIFDSGHAQLNVYSKAWKLIKEISMAGWGRGGDVLPEKQLFIAGVSAKRKRYLSFNEENKGLNMLQVFNFNLQPVHECVVPNVEQINNVYVFSDAQMELILGL